MDWWSRYFRLRPMVSLISLLAIVACFAGPTRPPQLPGREGHKYQELFLSPGHSICMSSLPPAISRVW